jgi:hypothetical protein
MGAPFHTSDTASWNAEEYNSFSRRKKFSVSAGKVMASVF